jgi:pyruvate-formate lyase-activating enzyme
LDLTLNGDPKMIDEMCGRFFPGYELTYLSPTPLPTLDQAYEIAKKNGRRREMVLDWL